MAVPDSSWYLSCLRHCVPKYEIHRAIVRNSVEILSLGSGLERCLISTSPISSMLIDALLCIVGFKNTCLKYYSSAIHLHQTRHRIILVIYKIIRTIVMPRWPFRYISFYSTLEFMLDLFLHNYF